MILSMAAVRSLLLLVSGLVADGSRMRSPGSVVIRHIITAFLGSLAFGATVSLRVRGMSSLTAFDDGNSKTNTLYWIATR